MNALLKVMLVACNGDGVNGKSCTNAAEIPQQANSSLVGYAPGGTADAVPRMISEKMSATWNQPVVVDNRPGAGGLLAAAALAKSTPDGHTLLFDGGNFAIGAVLQPSLPYDPVKDFAGVTRIGLKTTVMVVSPALGIKSVEDLIALAKAQPGKITFAASTAGSGPDLNGARFSLAAGIKTVPVAFKGASEQMIEVMAGRMHYSIASAFATMPFVQSGNYCRWRCLFLSAQACCPRYRRWGRYCPSSRMTWR